ncbi:hypothetical protein [Phyllobacterium sp. OV277]|uniref:hypothetical protein n=1 Tax=Phyllobacterium sp. OV277 TaxID=1882772 RepID=UPI00088C196F|nr:hypothetical protein [Phyllobacterium sp. OV277]SDP76068.1 hypothetical protein SAMN05443582_109126 [Phyllobacterium sp. OV277]
MTNQIISFREFLKTGILGPLSTDMKLIDVAEALGVPTFFFLHPDTEDVPVYWGYNKLEISFEVESPHPMQWFQIEHAGGLEGDFEAISDKILLALDGFNGDTKPSEFLLGELWNPDEVIVNLGALADDIALNICAGKISVLFQLDSTFIVDGDAERYIVTADIIQIINDIDGRTSLDSVYSHLSAEDAIKSNTWRHPIRITGREYLKAISI